METESPGERIRTATELAKLKERQVSENIVLFLQEWYQSKCDGTWEHAYGFDISNIDNPGWAVSINGEQNKKPIKVDIDNGDSWIVINANENEFKGYGGPGNLSAILEYAQEWLTPSQTFDAGLLNADGL